MESSVRDAFLFGKIKIMSKFLAMTYTTVGHRVNIKGEGVARHLALPLGEGGPPQAVGEVSCYSFDLSFP